MSSAHILRPRIILYTTILVAITVASIWSLATRVPLKVDVMRDPSVLSREADDGRIENVYNLKIMNTTEDAKRYAISVEGWTALSCSANPWLMSPVPKIMK
jgi:polyferredoxin